QRDDARGQPPHRPEPPGAAGRSRPACGLVSGGGLRLPEVSCALLRVRPRLLLQRGQPLGALVAHRTLPELSPVSCSEWRRPTPTATSGTSMPTNSLTRETTCRRTAAHWAPM